MDCPVTSPEGITLLYITTSDHTEAEAIARTPLEERLIACANILPGVASLYWWEGKISEAQECVLIAKTSEKCVDAVVERVRALHSYTCPCVVALPVNGGNPDFLQWIRGEVREGA